jgi:hypothetical protein
MADYTFDPRTGRYRDEAGRFVPDRLVREAVDRVTDEASARLAALSDRLAAQEIALSTWQSSAMVIVKDAHLAAGIAAHGGISQMDQQTYGAIGRQIRDEYQYLQHFAEAIANGSQPMTGVVARAQQYGQAARSTFEGIRARDDLLRGMDEERNILHASESCQQCRDLAALGWVPIGSLPPVGGRICRSNDRCSITRRHARAQEAQPRLLRAV